MVIAALACFAILLIAWIVAPDETPRAQRNVAPPTPEFEPAAA